MKAKCQSRKKVMVKSNKILLTSILSFFVIILIYVFYNNSFEYRYYSSGELLSKFSNSNSDIEVVCGKEFYKNGMIKYKYCKTKESGINGELQEFYESGKLKSVDTFINHLRNGISKTYSEGGKLIETLPFINGKMQGWAFKYETNGRKVNAKYYNCDSMYYLRIYDKIDTSKFDEQIFPKVHFDKLSYNIFDTVKITIVFKSDNLFHYKRDELLLYYDLTKLDVGNKKVPYERFFVNLSKDTTMTELILMNNGRYLFYTDLKHKLKRFPFENKKTFTKWIYVN